MGNNSQFSSKVNDITEGKSLAFKEDEKVLLSRIIKAKKEKDDDELREATWQLARLYGRFNKPEKSIKIVSHLIRITSDKGKLAFYIYSQGQLYEKMNDHATAIVYYRISLNLLPHTNQYIKYFVFNNSGFCYNILKDFTQGEKFCRLAIKLESGLSNAYKNLGISLEGQNRFLEAVETYLEATSKNASDSRAMHLLKDLILRHPEIRAEIQDLDQKIEDCSHKMPSAINFSFLLGTKWNRESTN